MNVGVLASGAGTNLQALIDRAHGRDGVQLVAVASDKPEARALGARQRGGDRSRGIRIGDGFADRPARDAAIAAWLRERGVELVVLAGYMQLLSPEFLADVPGRGHQCAPGAAAGVPGSAGGPAGARLRGQGVRSHRALRRWRGRHAVR